MIDGVAAMDRFLKLIASEPDICRVPLMIDSSSGRSSRPGSRRPGQADRQLDLDEGGRGGVPRPGGSPQVRRRGGRHGLRRAGAGRHLERRREICGRPTDRARRRGRASRRGHHHRPEHLRGGHGHRGARGLRHRLHRGHALDQGEPAGGPGLRRRLQRVVQLPRQQPVREAIHAVFLFHAIKAGHGHGHRQRRAPRCLRHRSTPSLRDGSRTSCSTAVRRHRPAARDRRGVQCGSGQEVADAAAEQWRSLPVARTDHARAGQGLDDTSRPTPRSCASRSPLRVGARSR
jgi:5-methyltetrahydrofolate--homocysteine methyltransferase